MNSGFEVRALPSAKRVSRARLRGVVTGDPGRLRQALTVDRERGVLEEWKDGRRYRYLAIGPFKYWHMYPVINRAQG